MLESWVQKSFAEEELTGQNKHVNRFRAFAQQARRTGRPPRKLFLAPDDRWWRPYYDPRGVKTTERRLFG